MKPMLGNDPTCQRLIKEALVCHLLPERKSLIQKKRPDYFGKETIFLLNVAENQMPAYLEEYDLRANMWRNRKVDFPHGLDCYLCQTAIVGTKLYIVGGRDRSTNTLLDTCCVDLETEIYSNFPETPSLKRTGHSEYKLHI